MPAAFIEKAGMELVGTFVKTVGLEAGKRVINGKPQKPKENHLTEIKEVKESVEIVNCSYDWEAIECNVDKVSEYAKLLAPVAGATMAGFFFFPVLDISRVMLNNLTTKHVAVNVCIDFRCRNRFMSEHALNGSQIGSTFQ